MMNMAELFMAVIWMKTMCGRDQPFFGIGSILIIRGPNVVDKNVV